jgi:hypothetical protein
MTSSDRHADARTRRAPPPWRTARWALAVLVAVASVVALLVPPSASQPGARDAERARLAWVAVQHHALEASAATPDAVPAFERLHAARPGSPRAVAVAGFARSAADGACPARSSSTVPAPPFEPPKAAGDLPEPEPPRATGAADPPPLRRAVLASSDPRRPQSGLAPPLRPPRA